MKIDTSSIDGFDGMTAEEKLTAVLGLEVPDKIDLTQYVAKATADKYALEAADWKKKYNSKLSDDEKALEERTAAQKDLQERYDILLRKTTIAENKSRYLSLGYSEKDAEKIATAQLDGDNDTVFKMMNTHAENLAAKIRSDLMKGTPKPEGAGCNSTSQESPAVALARQLGAKKAQSMKAAADGIKAYL